MKKNMLPIISALITLTGDQVIKYLTFDGFKITWDWDIHYIFSIAIVLITVISLFKSEKYRPIHRFNMWIIIAGFISNNIKKTAIFSIERWGMMLQFNIADLAVAIPSSILLLSILLKKRTK